MKPTKTTRIASATSSSPPKAKPSTPTRKPKPTLDPSPSPTTAIKFEAVLHQPLAQDGSQSAWTFLKLPASASSKLPSRGLVSVDGRFAGVPFSATLKPDGSGGHWLRVEPPLRSAAGVDVGDVVAIEVVPSTTEPEPTVPAELKSALARAPAAAREAWNDITPAARRDFIHWIESAKRAETRDKRVLTACDMLAKGKRRPCCFDRSGMYDKSLSCPVADDRSRSGR